MMYVFFFLELICHLESVTSEKHHTLLHYLKCMHVYQLSSPNGKPGLFEEAASVQRQVSKQQNGVLCEFKWHLFALQSELTLQSNPKN